MMPVRPLCLALIASLVLILGGCDDGTSPSDLGGLDPLALTDGLNRLLAPLQASAEANANLGAALPALDAAGVSPLPPEFPSDVTGSTFAYDVETGGWAVDTTLTGAPPAGVGVVWYTLDGTGEVTSVDDPRGRIRLQPVEGGASDSLALRVTESDGGETTTILDMVQGRESRGDGPTTEMFGARGTYSNGSATVAFAVTSDVTVDTVTDDEDYVLRVALEDSEMQYQLEVEGTVAGSSGDVDDLVTATAVRGGVRTVLEMSFRTPVTGGAAEASGTLFHAGDHVANISVLGNSYQFSKPGGGSFPAGQATELNALFTAMTRTGFLVWLNLPLFLP